jgi:drug/metabolite transporter (DMT)-like permease
MFGLVLASVMSVFNVFTDISRKKVLDRQYDVAMVSFWCKLVALFVYVAGIGVLAALGTTPALPNIGRSLGIPPLAGFVLYLMLNAILESTAILLNLRALQVSPISLCAPFMAATPLFLLPAGKFLLGESVSFGMALGVCLVVTGSLVANRQLFDRGLLEPAKAILRERGCRYMLIVAALLTVTNVLDKWFVTSGDSDVGLAIRLSRSFTLAGGKCAMLALFFVGLTIVRLGDWKGLRARHAGRPRAAAGFDWTGSWREMPMWMVLAGGLEAVVLVLQLTATQSTPIAMVIGIKRSGVILTVFLGWLIFKERGITDRVIASCVMVAGVLVFFLTKPDDQGHAILALKGAAGLAAAALAGMTLALYLTRYHGQSRDLTVAEGQAAPVGLEER